MISDLIDRLRWGRNTLHLIEFFVEEATAPLTDVTEDEELVTAGVSAA